MALAKITHFGNVKDVMDAVALNRDAIVEMQERLAVLDPMPNLTETIDLERLDERLKCPHCGELAPEHLPEACDNAPVNEPPPTQKTAARAARKKATRKKATRKKTARARARS